MNESIKKMLRDEREDRDALRAAIDKIDARIRAKAAKKKRAAVADTLNEIFDAIGAPKIGPESKT
jgi:hypothetical protein